MSTHPNQVPIHRLSVAELDALAARQAEDRLREHAERQRQAEWPMLVSQMLTTLAGRVRALEAEVAALRAGRG